MPILTASAVLSARLEGIRLARDVSQRRAPVCFAEPGQEQNLRLAGRCTRRLTPRDYEPVIPLHLPDVAPAPVAYGLPRAEVGELAEAAAKPVRLADVDDMRAFQPARLQDRDVDRRVSALEPSTQVLGEERRDGLDLAQDHVDAWSV